MPLDLWIYGPGLGECVVMAWDELDGDGGLVKTAAVIDCYGGDTPEKNPALHRLQELGNPQLAFVAVTHPHLDHVENMHAVLEAHKERTQKVWWWGGLCPKFVERTYGRLRRIPVPADVEEEIEHEVLGDCARHTHDFVEQALRLSGKGRRPCPLPRPLDLNTFSHVERMYQGRVGAAKVPLEIESIGPWIGPQTRFINDFLLQVGTDGSVRPRRLRANQTSLAFLVNYGDAQVLLGGDMERESWEELHRSGTCPKLNPTVIKVSHHGSGTGVMDGMWNQGNGFFESDRRPLCVVTPWNKAREGSRLPQDDVVENIRRAGCEVVVTGPKTKGVRRPLAGTHVRVHADGRHELLDWDRLNGQVLPPLI